MFKWGRRSKEAPGFDIGPPQKLERVVHVQSDGDGGFTGLPPELQRLLENMMTPEERTSVNIQVGKDIIRRKQEEDEKVGPTFMRPDEPENPTREGPIVTINISEGEATRRIRSMCAPGKPTDKYKPDIELGAGAGGSVCLAQNKQTKTRVAMKRIDMSRQDKKGMLLMEIKVMKDLNHKNLIN